MSFQWPVAKLDLINRALALTENNLVAQLEDGSDEYTVCSPAYEDAIAVLTEQHGWGWATQVRTLPPSPTAPADTAWDTAYPLPPDLIHLIWVKINQNSADPQAGLLSQPTLYDILNGQIVINAQGGPPPPVPPATPAVVTVKGMFNVANDVTAGTPLFVRALMTYVMSGIYRGLHGDPAEADKLFAAAGAMTQEARTRHDQQKPKRALLSGNSRITAARRVRRPWPQTGNNSWSGSGIPS
jgi:hypothetical protein